MQAIAIGTSIIILIIILIGLALEWRYRRRPSQPLDILPAQWNIDIYEPDHYRLTGELGLSNPHRGLEVMVPQLSAQVRLLSRDDIGAIDTTIDVIPRHPEPECAPRSDRYWFAYIVKSNKQTTVELVLDIKGPSLTALKAAWVQIHYIVYGPHGRSGKIHHEVIPLSFPTEAASGQWRDAETCHVLPIHTHLLTPLDRPTEIVKRYVLPHSQAGDIVTIGETPLAIMQSRWLDPSQLQPGWVARRVCQFFLPTSSLATACGMQALVEQVGALRVLLAFLGGSIAKIFGYRGGFYQLAGYQARLIDDVTGTLPPYDQFIVLGPDNPQGVVEEIKAETGLEAAIVDVNDLGAVKVLAATPGASLAVLEQALRKNPAGNADEQTPVVLIRPQASQTTEPGH
ncbi:F420-0:Gamma-glutamyl ligase [Candidatus Synechococcus calcipolaris G9]|uniref:F420-0:Gamma-glutamyl ligase n=1 Tax=Candidatus Synechococcus calcipolaris G9 TaxID=1497997 RepID=A0ABT6F2U5_9SYNE|nr:F420-0:Gamma-glutamyl ligase [Candidatus Synechococcus calcipolaris]MDG2992147.1 F420-0:Gamma-glutamyl ligase [Candidatus Synechococcus calcipolaris G9]